MVKIPGVTKLSSSKSLACFPNFNKHAIQSGCSRTELTFYLDAIQRTIATVLTYSVRRELPNPAIVQKINNGCYCWILVSRYNKSKGNKSKWGALLTSSCTDIKIRVSKVSEGSNLVYDSIAKTYWYSDTQAWVENTNWMEDFVFPMLITVFNNCCPFFWWLSCSSLFLSKIIMSEELLMIWKLS